jgi:ethanolamine utilization protein EutQ (cupin superfamily)
MGTSVKPVTVWKAGEFSYVAAGEGMRYCSPMDQGTFGYSAGYMDLFGGRLEWTEDADEIIWVIRGQVSIRSDGDVHEMEAGDLVLLREGAELMMTGSHDAQIAFIAHLHAPSGS